MTCVNLATIPNCRQQCRLYKVQTQMSFLNNLFLKLVVDNLTCAFSTS